MDTNIQIGQVVENSNQTIQLSTTKIVNRLSEFTLCLSLYLLYKAYAAVFVIYTINKGNFIIGTLPYETIKIIPMFIILPIQDVILSLILFSTAKKIKTNPKKGIRLAVIFSVIALIIVFVSDGLLSYQTSKLSNTINSESLQK